MPHWLDALRRGNWKSLFACFLYFDTGFTVWVMFGPLAPFVARQLTLSPSQSALLVAVPVLAAAIVRITFGNLFQCSDGRGIALLGIALSAVPALALQVPLAPSYSVLLVLGVFLGVGGASFAVALPMAGCGYPRDVQGLVLGLAAAGNIGAVLDGFLLPSLAQMFGWRQATAASLPLLLFAAAAVLLWAEDRSVKSGCKAHAVGGLLASFTGLVVLVLAVAAGLPVPGRSGLLLLPVLGTALAVALLPQRYRALLAERDTWVFMLVYSITFGGFVGMSSYVSLLLTTQYEMSKIEAGFVMALLAFTGAMVRPLGGLLADRLSGVRVLLVLLLAIALVNIAFAQGMPSLAVSIALLAALYVCFGLGNGATFQLVPQRWMGRTGIMTGLIGAAGGIGGFYLPVVMGLAKESTGSYQPGFAVFAALATLALGLVAALHKRWRAWAIPSTAEISLDEPITE